MGSKNYPRYMQRQWALANRYEAYIVLMHNGGMAVSDIAAELEVQAKFVTKVILSASKPKRDTSGDLPWTPEADRTIMVMRDQEGRRFVNIAAHLKRDPRDVQNRYHYLVAHASRQERIARRGERRCMTCQEVFISEDVVRNRRCEACKKQDSGVPDQFLAFVGTQRMGHGLQM